MKKISRRTAIRQGSQTAVALTILPVSINHNSGRNEIMNMITPNNQAADPIIELCVEYYQLMGVYDEVEHQHELLQNQLGTSGIQDVADQKKLQELEQRLEQLGETTMRKLKIIVETSAVSPHGFEQKLGVFLYGEPIEDDKEVGLVDRLERSVFRDALKLMHH